MDRITDKQLESTVAVINRMTGMPEKPYENGKANPGCYHIDNAYGKVSLAQMSNEGGGTRTIIHSSSKRELYDRMHAFIAGLDTKRKQDL